MSYTEFLKTHLCSNCSISILEPHPELKLSTLGWIKCKTCGYCKKIEVKVYCYIKKRFLTREEINGKSN